MYLLLIYFEMNCNKKLLTKHFMVTFFWIGCKLKQITILTYHFLLYIFCLLGSIIFKNFVNLRFHYTAPTQQRTHGEIKVCGRDLSMRYSQRVNVCE